MRWQRHHFQGWASPVFHTLWAGRVFRSHLLFLKVTLHLFIIFGCTGSSLLLVDFLWLLCLGLVALWPVESSPTRDQTCDSALAGRFLTTGPPRKSYPCIFLRKKLSVTGWGWTWQWGGSGSRTQGTLSAQCWGTGLPVAGGLTHCPMHAVWQGRGGGGWSLKDSLVTSELTLGSHRRLGVWFMRRPCSRLSWIIT